uniref:CMP/dCMP-type deaminase domain-containing protein n=1 Tax=Caenorhabditis japonica TaxID=281687 RepID=A0A8R1HNW8_CAEJA
MAEFMQLAVEEAKKGLNCGDGGPFGAVIVKNGKVIGQGHNMVLATKDPTAHAEVTAIRNTCKIIDDFDLSGCQLYTSCYPCPMCMGAALWSRLDAIYYGATSRDADEYGFGDHVYHGFVQNPKSDEKRILEQLTVDDYLEPFLLWEKTEDKDLLRLKQKSYKVE